MGEDPGSYKEPCVRSICVTPTDIYCDDLSPFISHDKCEWMNMVISLSEKDKQHMLVDIRDSDPRRLMKCNGLNIFSFTKNCCSLCLRITIAPPGQARAHHRTVNGCMWPALLWCMTVAQCVWPCHHHRHRNIPTSLAGEHHHSWLEALQQLRSLQLVVENKIFFWSIKLFESSGTKIFWTKLSNIWWVTLESSPISLDKYKESCVSA